MGLEKKVYHKIGEAISDFQMIKNNDKILICFSGGKDSFVLLKTLQRLQKISPHKFKIKVLVINPNYGKESYSHVEKYLKEENIDYEILSTIIGNRVLEKTQEKRKNYCYLCARFRRGYIYAYAKENNYNKIALGHNLDDAIETSLINTFYSFKTALMRPKYYSKTGDCEIIRPLIYCQEEELQEFTNLKKYTTIKQNCPLRNKDSKRKQFKEFIKKLKKNNPHIMLSAQKSFSNISQDTIWNPSKREKLQNLKSRSGIKEDYNKYIKDLTKDNMQKLFQENFGGWSDQVSENKYYKILEKGKVKLFFKNNIYIGYTSYNTEDNNHNSILINDIHILKEHQQKGYGTEILKNIIKIAKETNHNQIKIFVFKNNQAIKFYIKHKFKEIEYHEKSNTSIMIKKIN